MAAPLGPPPHSATTDTSPLSTSTRDRVPRAISTSTTLPSSIAIGPSGNRSPLAISRRSVIVLLGAGDPDEAEVADADVGLLERHREGVDRSGDGVPLGVDRRDLVVGLLLQRGEVALLRCRL